MTIDGTWRCFIPEIGIDEKAGSYMFRLCTGTGLTFYSRQRTRVFLGQSPIFSR